MSDSSLNQPKLGGDRLRASENDRYYQEASRGSDRLRSLQELHEVISSNRITDLPTRTLWSGPLARIFVLIGVFIIAVGWVYLAVQ